MKNKIKVLLTGGSGMVGKNILENSEINNWHFLSPKRSEVNFFDYKQTKEYFKTIKPEIVIHTAGYVGGIQANIDNPINFLVNNTDIGRNVIMSAYENNIYNLINLGSSCMYPKNGANPLKESSILEGKLEPTNEGYAISKIYSTKLCEYIMRENSKFNYKTIIPCNLYGKYDNFSLNQSHLIPSIIKKIHLAKKNNKKNVKIWGNGNVRREFMYAGDFANSIIYALKNFSTMPNLLNIGLGYDFSVKKYYQIVSEVINWKGEFIHELDKPVGMLRKCVDISLQKKWGWHSTTEIKNGIEKTYKYFLSISK